MLYPLCAGAGCDIHPPPKQYCAQRLAKSALAIAYGQSTPWRSPSFASQTFSASPAAATVTFADASPAGLRDDQVKYKVYSIRCNV